jgi:WhiB family redox-sensing transcriptional regulator
MIYNMDWASDCACRGRTELFFAPNGATENSKQRRTREKIALSICNSCPVILECRAHARLRGEQGIWGGETDEDRWNAGYMRNNPAVARLIRAREYRNRKEAEKRAALRASAKAE